MPVPEKQREHDEEGQQRFLIHARSPGGQQGMGQGEEDAAYRDFGSEFAAGEFQKQRARCGDEGTGEQALLAV